MPGPFTLLYKRHPIALAFGAYKLWRRLPPKQRRRILQATRRHGPRVAKRVISGRRRPKR
jgi:hypothetical protein